LEPKPALASGPWVPHFPAVPNVPDFPEWIQPMAATLTQERFAGPEWTFERKYDGIRLIAFKNGADVRLYSRTHNPQELPAIRDAIARLPAIRLVLDGELTWDRATAFHVFDVVWLDDRDLSPLPLSERRRILEQLPLQPPLHRTESLDVAEPWEHARREGWEGVIAKRIDSPYEQKRSKHWLKMKCEIAQPFVVGGFTDPQGSRVGLGALLVGYYDGEDFVFAGKVGTGFDTAMLNDLRGRFDMAAVEKTPFTRATGLPRLRQHWVRPEVVVNVAFIEWTTHEKLRHSRLLGLMTGVDPRSVRRIT
jgi:bifunctional non-homologous end joining protein LigD